MSLRAAGRQLLRAQDSTLKFRVEELFRAPTSRHLKEAHGVSTTFIATLISSQLRPESRGRHTSKHRISGACQGHLFQALEGDRVMQTRAAVGKQVVSRSSGGPPV